MEEFEKGAEIRIAARRGPFWKNVTSITKRRERGREKEREGERGDLYRALALIDRILHDDGSLLWLREENT